MKVASMTHARTLLLAASATALVLAGSLFLNLPATAQTRNVRTSRPKPATKSTPAPRAINGEEMQSLLKRNGSRPLLVNFWATWCDPCRDEFPELVQIDTRYRPKGLDFIAISLDDFADLNTAVPKFLGTMKAKMPVYLLNVADPEPAINAVDKAWSGALPATFLYDKNGQLVYKHLGRINAVELRAAIEKLVNAKQ
jgi:thiol-disulfide isomerase/thioredoxin